MPQKNRLQIHAAKNIASHNAIGRKQDEAKRNEEPVEKR